MHLQLGEVSTVIVSRPEAFKVVMKILDSSLAYRPHLISSSIIYDQQAIIAAAVKELGGELTRSFNFANEFVSIELLLVSS